MRLQTKLLGAVQQNQGSLIDRSHIINDDNVVCDLYKVLSYCRYKQSTVKLELVKQS